MPILNINADAIIQHTARLEKISKSAIPVAVRQTLNAAAYDVKVNTMPDTASILEKREPNFLKANSRVEQAQGFDVNNMRSIVGFANLKPKPVPKSDMAVQDLEQQEDGGEIAGRALIALKGARQGNSFSKRVLKKNKLLTIDGKIVDSDDSEGTSKGQRFIRAAIFAGKGGVVMGNKRNGRGNKTIYRINSIKRIGSGTVINSTPIYVAKAGRTVSPKPTHFMEIASVRSANKMEGFYLLFAEKKIAAMK